MDRSMRWWAAIAIAGFGCVQPVTAPVAQPQQDSPRAMDGAVYDARIAGLRATLARNHVAIDTQPLSEDCFGANCVDCDLASPQNTGGIDPTLIDAVSLAFAAYPPSLIKATRLEHVALCRTIRLRHSFDQPPAGVAIVDERRLLISLEAWADDEPVHEFFSISQVVHHEMFHLFDHATLHEIDSEWEATNPKGFAYGDPAPEVYTRPTGFVRPYSTTNAREDRATVFEYLMGQPERLCEIMRADPVVAAKTKLVWNRVAKVVGSKLLRQHAPCVGLVDKPRKKTPPKLPPPATTPGLKRLPRMR